MNVLDTYSEWPCQNGESFINMKEKHRFDLTQECSESIKSKVERWERTEKVHYEM